MATRQKTRSVLVIEDEAEIRNFAFRVLELEGYHVLKAGNGNDGLKMVKSSREIAMVLLDLRLPGRDGWGVLQEMKKDPKLSGIPVVVFSALAAAWQKKKALTMGAAGYLTKPVDAASLKKAVSATIHQKGAISACHPGNH
ncbi:MAG TPA: response regulator [Dehalococcoidia bacterium]|nr:response regulator [Dehalococcoidia bacterium]